MTAGRGAAARWTRGMNPRVTMVYGPVHCPYRPTRSISDIAAFGLCALCPPMT